ncbi:MAG: response regulator [Solirubrobacteraceae bacterium]
MSIRVLLADDQVLIRSGFAALISSAEDLEVVGEAGDGNEAVRLARELHPDVVLMDIRMPGRDGLSASEQIARDPDLSDVRIVVLTTFDNDDYVLAALHAGASGFLGKSVEPADLLEAVRVVAAGEALLSPTATKALIGRYLAQPRASRASLGAGPLEVLTPREREIVAFAAHGLSNDDIAQRLYLSPLTVKTHINRAMAKLDVRDRAQLVVLAFQYGLVTIGKEGSPRVSDDRV